MKLLFCASTLVLALSVTSCGKNKTAKGVEFPKTVSVKNDENANEWELFAFSQKDLVEITKVENGIVPFTRKFNLNPGLKKDFLKNLKYLAFYGDMDEDLKNTNEVEIFLEARTSKGNGFDLHLMKPKSVTIGDKHQFFFQLDDKFLKEAFAEKDQYDFRIVIWGSNKESESTGKFSFTIFVPFEK